MKKWVLIFIVLASTELLAWGQGHGGGIWLEDGASCLGTIIYKNTAKDGFGVAGQDGILLNSTVVENTKYKPENYYPKPGDIYCADGDIVDGETYKKRTKKNAIGVVYWINGNPDILYPQGAVVALGGQERCQWGDPNASEYTWLLYDKITETNDTRYAQKDTACYGNTYWMVNKYKEYGNKLFEAGYYCWTYKAYYQKNTPDEATKNIRWCMPTLTYLKRMMVVSPELMNTLSIIKQTNPELIPTCDDFVSEEEDNAYYWSADDGYTDYFSAWAWCVNFKSGSCNLDETHTLKNQKNLVRPIFIY